KPGKGSRQRRPQVRSAGALGLRSGEPGGRLFDRPTHVKDEGGWRDPQDEHAAPTDQIEKVFENNRCQEIPKYVAFLEKPRKKTAVVRGECLERQRRTHPPFASHRNAEERSQEKKRG